MAKERIPAKPNTLPDRPLRDERDLAESLNRRRRTKDPASKKKPTEPEPEEGGLGPRG